MITFLRRRLLLGWIVAFSAVEFAGFAQLGSAPANDPTLKPGRELYLKNCFICHQLNGQGIPGSFPPLAGSDYLRDREKTIRAVCEGVTGEVNVNGKKFFGFMPPVVLDDTDVSAVLTYVLQSWGNSGTPVTAEMVKEVRAKTAFPTFAALQQASTYAPLPKAPEGFALREVAKLSGKGVRLASNGQGDVLYVLFETGDVWQVQTRSGQLRQVLWAARYLEHLPGDVGGPLFVLGLAIDSSQRLYIAANQPNNAVLPVQNRVTIYRTATLSGDLPTPKPWFETNYPGNAAYVHGMEHIAFGPDGFLYAGNGARTDAGQSGTDTNYFMGGETPITSSIWRLNPAIDHPALEVFARGVRNAYGFCWNDKGEMFATENGPDADAPEELNLIERGKHYGFPYQFADWTHKAYAHSPDPPAGLKFTLPIANLGPDGGFDGKPLFTFDPHSGPDGIAFLGQDFPPQYRGTFVIARFGNFIRTPKDNVGFDLLNVRLEKDRSGTYAAHVTTMLAPLARPIDVHVSGKGKIYICEYSRPTNNQQSYSMPGRILELSVSAPKTAALESTPVR